MKRTLLLALPLLCATALADDATPPTIIKTDDGPAVLVTPQDETVYLEEEDEETREYRSPLNHILAFVYDRATADAAAPRVKALLAAEPDQPELPDETEHYLIDSFDCYGSTALKEALMPLYAEEFEESPELLELKAKLMPVMNQMVGKVAELAQALDAVTDEASAAKAAELMRAYPASQNEVGAQLQSIMMNMDSGIDNINRLMASLSTSMLESASALFLSYAHAQSSREGGYPELQSAFFTVLLGDAVVEDIPAEVLKQMEPATLIACEKQGQVLREWLGMASRITDTASADAAADWLALKSAELGVPLGSFWREHVPLGRPGVDELSGALGAACACLEHAAPAWYGSEKLKALLHYKYDRPTPSPAEDAEPIEFYDDEDEEPAEDYGEDYEEE